MAGSSLVPRLSPSMANAKQLCLVGVRFCKRDLATALFLFRGEVLVVGFPFFVMERHSLKGKQCLGDEMAEEMREQGISERNLPTGR